MEIIIDSRRRQQDFKVIETRPRLTGILCSTLSTCILGQLHVVIKIKSRRLSAHRMCLHRPGRTYIMSTAGHVQYLSKPSAIPLSSPPCDAQGIKSRRATHEDYHPHDK